MTEACQRAGTRGRIIKYNPIQFNLQLVNQLLDIGVLDLGGFPTLKNFDGQQSVIVLRGPVSGDVQEDVIRKSAEVGEVFSKRVYGWL